MNNLFSVKDKVVVITGGTGVLGSEMARSLASQGAKVAVLGRNEKKKDQVVAEITSAGGKALGVICDVLSKESLVAAKNAILKEYGTIDVLISGAGGNSKNATTSPELSLFDLPEGDLNWVMELNFLGTLLPIQVFSEIFVEKKEGVILNVSSMASMRPLTNVLGYASAKAAINNLTQWLAVHFNKHYSKDIRVNAIAPGFFLTEQNRFLLTEENTGELTARGQTIIDHTPMNRFGEPADLNGTVTWLISPASKFVTGTVIPVDGGFSAFSGV